MKELKAVIHFVCSVEFWRMALLWPVSLLTSHFQLLFQNLFPRKSNPYKRCVPPITGIKRPVCIVTGVSHLHFSVCVCVCKFMYVLVLPNLHIFM